ncbi:hypothetical protein TWF730_002133 [Orbilia blumenaviensis]|uniref:Kelch repeat protein n=1 Tax=Orbilia blumenaviensis TaxID=1796055 RepID=A0AAV9UD22_9PEZI
MAKPEPQEYFGLKFIRNHQTVYIGTTLWIDGGEVLPITLANFSNSTIDRSYAPNPYLYSLDLSESIIVAGNTSNNRIDQLWDDGRLKLIEKPTNAGTSSGGTLFNYKWSDPRGGRSQFVQFGGRTGDGADLEGPLFEYNTQDSEFDEFTVRAKTDDIIEGGYLNPHHGAAAQSLDGFGYYLGGMDATGKYLKQLVKLNLSNGEISVEDTGDMPALVGSQMSWYPVGKKGILVSIGGEMIDASGRIRSIPMETVWVYDILSSKWYSQIATPADDVQGLPLDRKFFCAVSPSYTEAADTYEIILHGGHRTVSDDFLKLDDVWALTLPTFQWVQYYFGLTGDRTSHGAYNVSCSCPNDRYFMVVSTYGFGTEYANYPFAWYDLTNLGWSHFDANAQGYERPQLIRTTVGRRREPDSWDSPALAEVFAQAYTRGFIDPSATSSMDAPATGTGNSVPTITGDGDPTFNGSGSKKNTAAIAAGASVGGIVFVAAILFALFFIRRKRQRNLPPVPTPGQEYGEAPYPPPPGGFDRPLSELHSSHITTPRAELPSNRQFVELDSAYDPVKPNIETGGTAPVQTIQVTGPQGGK